MAAQGSYWSLEKRRDDLAGLPAEWARTVAAFQGWAPATFRRPPVVRLGARLQAAAERLAQRLEPGAAEPGRTLVHGDFKTANLFIAGAADPWERVLGSEASVKDCRRLSQGPAGHSGSLLNPKPWTAMESAAHIVQIQVQSVSWGKALLSPSLRNTYLGAVEGIRE